MNIRRWAGVARSLAIYYGNPFLLRRMTAFYRQFIQPDDLCFDIGAHVGNRVFVWNRLGARTVAVEPQPHLYALLQRFYGGRSATVLRPEALAECEGTATLFADSSNPTVSTLSDRWIAEVQQEPSFAGINWQPEADVPTITLDTLITEYGRPAFCKIDVEGHERQVLAGLSVALPALSFEFLPVTIERAIACLERLGELGDYEFNWFRRESHRWELDRWLSGPRMVDALYVAARQPDSGDVFARLRTGQSPEAMEAASLA